MSRPNLHPHEQRILKALVANLNAAGFFIAGVWTEEVYMLVAADGSVEEVDSMGAPDLVRAHMTEAQLLQVFEDYSMSTPTVHFTIQHNLTWGNNGVMVVPGNRKDFISDWHCGDKAFDAIVDQVSSAAFEGAWE